MARRHPFHPDLAAARFIPRFTFGPRLTRLTNRTRVKVAPTPDDMVIEDVTVPGAVRVRLYRPKGLHTKSPVLLWFHGGGYILGTPEQDEASSTAFARDLGIVVASVDYRLAPEHPSPAAVEDAYAAFTWLVHNARKLNIDPKRIVVGGVSAGAGLAAALAQFAHDNGSARPAFQLLVYPMLDDRTVTRTDLDARHARMWSPASNLYAWSSYLGHAPGLADAPAYAAPARRLDVRGLPPAWLGVGTLDLFHDEGVEYAGRLNSSGVECELYVVPGAFHGFDVAFAKAEVTREFRAEQVRALREALLR